MFVRVYRFCRTTVSSSPKFFAFNMVMILVWSCCYVAGSYTNKMLFDAVIAAQSHGRFGFAVVLPTLLFFLAITLSGNTANFDAMMSAGYTKTARKWFSKLFLYRSYRTDQDRFYERDFYDHYEFVKRNIGKTSDIAVVIFNKLAMAVFNVALSIAAITVFDGFIALPIAVLSVVFALLNRHLVKKRVALNRQYISDERKAEYYKSLLTDRSHAKELRMFRLRDEWIARWERHYGRYAPAKFAFEAKAAILNGVVGLFDKLMPPCFAIYYIYQVSLGRLTAGDAVFLTSVVWMLNWGVSSLIHIVTRDLNESSQYAGQYAAFVGEIGAGSATGAIDAATPAPAPLAYGEFRELRLDRIRYRYPHSGEEAVRGTDFRLKRGEVVSILGYNGSGKTTLSKIACGLLGDYEGNVTLNGRDMRELDGEQVSRYFGVAFQDYARYSISLLDNVAVGMIEKADDRAEIDKAIRKGNLGGMIGTLPDGPETILGKEYDSRGQDVSGGQWQRISLARAYMGEPEVLVLDEPTASVDPLEEMRMLNRFKDIVRGKTAILISHRIGFARLSDRICVMDGGVIAEEGTHEQLMRLQGRYCELVTAQRSLYAESGVSEEEKGA